MQDTIANLVPPDAARRAALLDAMEFISGWRHPSEEVRDEVSAPAVV